MDDILLNLICFLGGAVIMAVFATNSYDKGYAAGRLSWLPERNAANENLVRAPFRDPWEVL